MSPFYFYFLCFSFLLFLFILFLCFHSFVLSLFSDCEIACIPMLIIFQYQGMVRFFAPLFLGKLAPKYMNPGPASSIIITTGSVSERPLPDWTVVNSYATGLQGMVRGMALDLKPLRINLVSPGVVDTELWKDMPEDVKRGMFAEMEKKIPVGRVGQVVDVAESYLYLMKDRNVSGAMVSTSGGHLLV